MKKILKILFQWIILGEWMIQKQMMKIQFL